MIFRRNFKNETYQLNVDDLQIAELLSISIDGVNVQGKNALKEATVYTCIKIRAGAMAKLPVKLYKNRAIDSQHKLNKILKLRPNPYMSARDFKYALEVQKCIYGNAYANIEFDRRGQIIGLWLIDNAKAKVEIWVDNKALLSSKTLLWYVITVEGKEFKLKADEILHYKEFTTDGLIGLSPLQMLASTVENAKSASDYINKFYKNGLQTKGLIQYTGDLTPTAEKKFRERFEQMSSGLDNAHRVALMPYGYQFTPIKMTLTDAEFLNNNMFTLRQIAAAFGVKPHQLNDNERSTYSNMSEQQREFYIDTLMDVITGYEQENNYKLFTDSEISDGSYIKYNVDAITRADIKTRYDAYQKAIQSGFKSPNEVRELEDDEPKKGGDVLLVNGNMVPIERAGAAYDKKGG